MERAVTYITLDVQKIDSGQQITAKRGDSARRLVVSLTNRGRPYIPGEDVTAVFYERKPDGNPCFNAADIDGCTVTYDFTGQTTNVVGLAACEIRLYDAQNHLLTSPRFELLVDGTEYREGDVPDSSPEFTALTQMVGEGTAIIEELREALTGLDNVEEVLAQAKDAATAAARSEENATRAAGTAQSASGQSQAAAERAEASATGAATSLQAATEQAQAAAVSADRAQQLADGASAAAQVAASSAGRADEAAKRAEDAAAGGVAEETDPTVPAWAKATNKPTYTAAEVGADPAGTAVSNIQNHNVGRYSHEDIRIELRALADRINAALNSTDTDLDQLAEIVAYIKSNKSLIDAITTSKVSVTDIVDNLSTNVTGRPLSAAQGVVLKVLIDELSTGKMDTSALPEAIKTALAQAKKNGEFDGEDGEDGITPHIGDNGNWFSGDTDTGVPATGPQGEAGVSGVYTLSDGESLENAPADADVVIDPGGVPTTETWVFTLADGTTVEKQVYVYEV